MKLAQVVFIGPIAMATPRDATAAALIVVPFPRLARTERCIQLDGVSYFYLSPALVPRIAISQLCPVSKPGLERGIVLHGVD